MWRYGVPSASLVVAYAITWPPEVFVIANGISDPSRGTGLLSAGRNLKMSNAQDVEFGLDSFVPISVDASGHELSGDVVIRNTVEEAVLADAVGIDSFNIAEHYRKEMMDSASSIILATVAGRTKRIRLGTAVTVLSTHDPVRVYTEFATLDAVSNG